MAARFPTSLQIHCRRGEEEGRDESLRKRDRPIQMMRPHTLRPYLPTSALRKRGNISRRYAVQAPGAPTLEIFNQHVKYLQKERAASNAEQSRKVEYIRDEVAQRLCERLLVWSVPSEINPPLISFF